MNFFSKTGNSISKRLFWRAHLDEAITQITRVRPHLVTTDMVVTAPLLFQGIGYFSSMEAKQNMRELLALAKLIDGLHPERVCEIGTHKGGTLFVWCQLAAPEAVIVSIDLPGGDFGGGFGERSIPFFNSFAKPMQALHFIRGDSHAAPTKARLEGVLSEGKLDFLLIDGDHSYDGVKRDFEDYAPLVRSGGLVAFHDIVKRDEYPSIEVWRFWAELKKEFRCEEFIDADPAARSIGIGVVHL